MKTHDRTSFFKYVSADIAKIVLTNQTLRWSSPILFNDPFDVVRELAEGITPSEIQECMIDRIIDIIENKEEFPFGLLPKLRLVLEPLRQSNGVHLKETVIKASAEHKIKLIQESIGLNELKKMWKDTIPDFRILCLSARNDSASMWNHYADKYRGAVLEIVCRDDFHSPWLIAEPVQYPTGRPSLLDKTGWGKILVLEQQHAVRHIIHESSYTKTVDWAYEQEWRVVSFKRRGEHGEYSDYKFHPLELGAIYLGPEISQEDKDDIGSLLTHDLAHVNLFAGRVSGGQYIKFEKMSNRGLQPIVKRSD